MPAIAKDAIREHRIDMEVVVDANDDQERAIGWYTYLEDKLAFLFACGPGPPLVPDDYRQLNPRCPDLR
jgi:Calcium binding